MERTAQNRVIFEAGAKKEKSRNPHGYWIFRWRRVWDSNPRALADNRISSAARYDHFDTLPYHKYAVLGESHMISSAARYDHFDNSPCIYLQHQLKNQPRKKERTDGEISKHTAQSSRH